MVSAPGEHFIGKEIPLWHYLFRFMTFFLILVNILLPRHTCTSAQQCNFWNRLWQNTPLYILEPIVNPSLCFA